MIKNSYMKKLLIIAITIVFLGANSASAQSPRIAYIRIDDIVSLMPDLQKVNMDTVGLKLVQDSIQPEIERIAKEFDDKQVLFAKFPAVDTSVAKLRLGRELDSLRQELQGADDYVKRFMQFKQQEFLKPYYKKAKDAIDAVAKRKGYTFVVSPDVLLVAPQEDNISLAVLTELKIQLPGQKPNTGGTQGGAKPTGTKPPAKPPVKKPN
jgi:outer membrane protein